MSGVTKVLKKVFKPVVKLVKKVAVPVLIGGALVLTAGSAAAAMGVAGLPSWGSFLGAVGGGATAAGASQFPTMATSLGAAKGAGLAVPAGLIGATQPTGGILKSLAGGVRGVASFARSNPLLSYSLVQGVQSHYANEARMENQRELMRLRDEYRGGTYYGMPRGYKAPEREEEEDYFEKRKRYEEQGIKIRGPEQFTPKRSLMTVPEPAPMMADPNMARTQAAPRSLGQEDDEELAGLMQPLVPYQGQFTPGLIHPSNLWQTPALMWDEEEVPA